MLLNIIIVFSTVASGSLGSLERSTQKWLNIRKQQVASENEWRTEKRLLNSEVARLEKEVGKQTSISKELDDDLANSKKKHFDYVNSSNSQKNKLKEFSQFVENYQESVENSIADLPQFVRKKYEALVKKDFITVSEKLSALLDFREELNKDAKKWHLVSEVITIGENSYSLEVLYSGFSVGYGVSRDNSVAAIMTVVDGKVLWKLSLESADVIRLAINKFSKISDKTIKLPFEFGDVK